MLKIGITGGIGSGKSVVCRIFKTLGVPVYDADSQARKLMNRSAELIEKIQDAFGKETYKEGKLDRQHLAQKVFGNPEALQKLNSLVHPAVASDFEKWTGEQSSKGHKYAIKEAAVMLEHGKPPELDYVIAVSTPEDIRIDRIKLRDPQRSEEQIKSIMARQLPQKTIVERADFEIKNNDSLSVLQQALELHKKLSL
ncbi:dephospho-CoA kinase [Fulvitalea axinellae]|uniref:Dephospho-CoA kinase n=1 Tax=Fulvitalea axinellae TaxID=1182444 RepID=A0AAU9D3F1_9BACT|nr:dephospho-CoA kinase [Fulvitalea axinellae]